MADEAKGIPSWVWLILALVVVWFIIQKTTAAAKQATGELGKGIGKGATETLISKGADALGSFLGGFFSGKKASAADSEDDFDDGEGYDTSSFRVYDD